MDQEKGSGGGSMNMARCSEEKFRGLVTTEIEIIGGILARSRGKVNRHITLAQNELDDADRESCASDRLVREKLDALAAIIETRKRST